MNPTDLRSTLSVSGLHGERPVPTQKVLRTWTSTMLVVVCHGEVLPRPPLVPLREPTGVSVSEPVAVVHGRVQGTAGGPVASSPQRERTRTHGNDLFPLFLTRFCRRKLAGLLLVQLPWVGCYGEERKRRLAALSISIRTCMRVSLDCPPGTRARRYGRKQGQRHAPAPGRDIPGRGQGLPAHGKNRCAALRVSGEVDRPAWPRRGTGAVRS